MKAIILNNYDPKENIHWKCKGEVYLKYKESEMKQVSQEEFRKKLESYPYPIERAANTLAERIDFWDKEKPEKRLGYVDLSIHSEDPTYYVTEEEFPKVFVPKQRAELLSGAGFPKANQWSQ